MKIIVCPICGAVKDYRLTETIKRKIIFDAEGRKIESGGESVRRTARKLCACGRTVRVIDIPISEVRDDENTGN